MTTTRRRRTRTTRRASASVKAHGPLPPPVRLTRVRTALKRIATGYYDRDDVRDRLAAAVLSELRKS
jgi:hypothetical protein